jgi:hypothetical protein
MNNLDIQALNEIATIDMTVDGLFDMVNDHGLERAVELYVKQELFLRLTESQSYFRISAATIVSAVNTMFDINKGLYMAEAKVSFLEEYSILGNIENEHTDFAINSKLV